MFQLLTDLKQQRKESGKSKQSSGQQNLNTIMYEVGDTVNPLCKISQAAPIQTVRSFLHHIYPNNFFVSFHNLWSVYSGFGLTAL